MKIKSAQLSDVQAIQNVYLNAPEYFEMLGTEIPSYLEIESELGLALMDNKRHVELIEIDGQIVGMLDYKVAYPQAGDLTINLLLLCPEVRNKGIGSVVMHEFEQRLPTGTQRLMASVLGENPAGVRFWERLGYQFSVDARPVMRWYAKDLATTQPEQQQSKATKAQDLATELQPHNLQSQLLSFNALPFGSSLRLSSTK